MQKRAIVYAVVAMALALPALAADPTTWRLAAGGNMVNGEFQTGVLGFNLADVSALSNLNRLPDGVKGLIYIGSSAGGCTGNSAQFRAFVEPYKGNPKLWGFYLMDEPYAKQVGSTPPCPMANLKAETDYIHANFPGVVSYVKIGNIGTTAKPDYLDFGLPGMLDVYGIGGYPCRTATAPTCDLDMINRYVVAALDAKIPREKMAPTYQAFGGWSNQFFIPSAAQEQDILNRWKTLLPNPPMFMAYSYNQQPNSTGAISTVPHLQAVFRDWNLTASTPPEPEPEPPTHPEEPTLPPCMCRMP
jgi:hypothetical protein